MVYKEVEHIFGLKNIPAFRDEEFISTSKDHMTAMNFQLAVIYYSTGAQKKFISTWEDLCKDLLKASNYGKYINDSKKEARKILPTLGLEGKNEDEKVRIISDYVKGSFNWDGFYGKYTSKKVSDLLKTKRGNAADINLFLVGLLTEAQLKVTPVILSTREHGRIDKSYPFINYYNYTLAEVTLGDKKIFIDATEPMLPYKSVPTRCVNTEALSVEKTPKWTFIRQKTMAYLEKNLDINIKSADDVQVKADYKSAGQTAYTLRSKYLGKEENLAKYLKDTEDVNVEGTIQTSNYTDLDEPFNFDFTFHTKAEGNNDKIFFNPFVNLFSKDNLFKQTSRALPIDMNELITRRFATVIHIPEGYVYEFIPKSLSFTNDVMQISYHPIVEGDVLKIEAAYSFKNYEFPAKKYAELKNTYAKMLSKLTEMIVVSKKEAEKIETQ